jgi:diguanylate cyclase (GGDEF)-like protein
MGRIDDARIDELEYLTELARQPEGRTEPEQPEDTPHRRMLVHLLNAQLVNGMAVDAPSPASAAWLQHAQMSDLEWQASMKRAENIANVLNGKPVEVRISHKGRVRVAELRQQLKTGREREPFGVLIARRHFDADLKTAILDASQVSPVSVAVLDVNGLKVINDKRGHPAGDAMLKVYLQTVADVVGNKGEGYRGDGGDEVFVIMQLTIDDARALMEKVLKQLAKESHKDGHYSSIEAACGLASTTDPAFDHDALLKAADDAETRAKKASKDKDGRPSMLAVDGETDVHEVS